MIRPISFMSGIVYKYLAKPLLFRRKPDDVHVKLLKAGTRMQRYAIIRKLLHASWAYNNEAALSQDMHGLHFKNPVGLSAGFDKNFELAPLLKSIGFGFMEGGSVTFHPCDGNPRPWFYRLPKTKSLVVYAGLANEGVKKIVKRIKGYPAHTFDDFVMNISVAKTNSKQAASEAEAINDYLGSIEHIQRENMGDILTLNISCPNTYGGEPFTTPQRLEKLLSAVDKHGLTQPVFIKMPSNLEWDDFRKLLLIIVQHTVAGVTISNLQKDRSKANLKDELPDSVKGNLSGKPTWEASNMLIRKTYEEFGNKLTIIGVGGIFSAEDAYTKIKLGASLVELITGMIFEGPQLIGQINSGLTKLLQQDGYQNISEVIGTDVKPGC